MFVCVPMMALLPGSRALWRLLCLVTLAVAVRTLLQLATSAEEEGVGQPVAPPEIRPPRGGEARPDQICFNF